MINVRAALLGALLCVLPSMASATPTNAAFETAPMAARDADRSEAKRGQYTQEVEVATLVGEAGMKSFAPFLDPDHVIEFDVYVPETYYPTRPAGLLVFVSPTAIGKIPSRWRRIIMEHNLIWVSIKGSGNNISLYRRMIEASVSPAFVAKNYEIDPARVYISGFSGGGRVSSLAATFYPQLFNGAIYMSGVDPWGINPPALLPLIKKNRFVFLTGSNDFNQHETRQVFHVYEEAGVEGIKLMVVNNLGHDMPGADKLDEALGFLDAGAALAP